MQTDNKASANTKQDYLTGSNILRTFSFTISILFSPESKVLCQTDNTSQGLTLLNTLKLLIITFTKRRCLLKILNLNSIKLMTISFNHQHSYCPHSSQCQENIISIHQT